MYSTWAVVKKAGYGGGGGSNSTCREESLKKSNDISLTGEEQIGHFDQPTAESVATAVVRSLNVMY